MTSARARVFYGWRVALIAGLGLFLNTGTIVVFSFGVFAKAMGQESHIPLPMLVALLKERPENMGLLPDGAAESPLSTPIVMDELGLTLGEAAKTSAFWIIVCVLLLVAASVHACFIHLPALLTDRGSTAQLAAFGSSLLGVGLFIGRVGCGYLLDRFFAPRVAALLFSAVAVGIALLALSYAISSALVAAALVGLGLGAEVDIVAYLTSRYFGLRSYGAVFGSIWAVFGVSGGLGAYLMGLGFDRTGSYVVPLSGFFCAALLAALLTMMLGPYRYGVGLSSEAT